jgi:hypothetical protein
MREDNRAIHSGRRAAHRRRPRIRPRCPPPGRRRPGSTGMPTRPPSVRIFLSTRPTDMRRGFDERARMTTEEIKQDLLSGALFVFRNRRGGSPGRSWRGAVWTRGAGGLNLVMQSDDRVAQSVEQRTSTKGRAPTRSLSREETEPRRVNAAVCWDALKARATTTSSATANVKV